MKLVRLTGPAQGWGVLDGAIVRQPHKDATLPEVIAADALPIEHSAEAVTIGTPISDGAKIFCVGLNYRDHVLEMKRQLPTHPVIFPRFADSFVADGEPIEKPAESDQFDFEGELVVVIGKGGRHIAAEDAAAHVLGYTLMNDGSLRDFQFHTHQYTPGKNFENSGSVGPAIVTADEVGELAGRGIRTILNGEVVQDSELGQLIFPVSDLIAYISSWTPLRPGDLIATGTPGGVGSSRTPQLWMRPGDECVIEIDGIGRLSNIVAASS
ncbi:MULTISPECIES: fumarylacetoacetate hydrolase family protein [unclassified Diaminobutyricimonas]|uniref:fumarylacetoacetate hydrolase family protein n=1 Tax=unclassified Diaminobutyricimonas TaxID=2643261 RepID=UPI0012F4BEA4|nr:MULTISPECIES: fumarylacetoacetate hydrolase family protein [unclassified Diaminobutyricimonas]